MLVMDSQTAQPRKHRPGPGPTDGLSRDLQHHNHR